MTDKRVTTSKENLSFKWNFVDIFVLLFSLFQLFGFVCDKRKHQAAVVVLIAVMSVQGIMNLQVQFVSALFFHSLSSINSLTYIKGVHIEPSRHAC